MPNTQSPATLAQRITNYLADGGLFNPELAKHDAVRDLLIECRNVLAAHRQPDPLPEGMPEPDFTLRWDDHAGYYRVNKPGINLADCYTAGKLSAYGLAQHAAGRRQGLEEAAKVCEERMNKTAFELEAERCAAAIRDLMKD